MASGAFLGAVPASPCLREDRVWAAWDPQRLPQVPCKATRSWTCTALIAGPGRSGSCDLAGQPLTTEAVRLGHSVAGCQEGGSWCLGVCEGAAAAAWVLCGRREPDPLPWAGPC